MEAAQLFGSDLLPVKQEIVNALNRANGNDLQDFGEVEPVGDGSSACHYDLHAMSIWA